MSETGAFFKTPVRQKKREDLFNQMATISRKRFQHSETTDLNLHVGDSTAISN